VAPTLALELLAYEYACHKCPTNRHHKRDTVHQKTVNSKNY